MEDFEYLAFLLLKGSLVKPPQYIFEQVLYYYQKEELRVTPLFCNAARKFMAISPARNHSKTGDIRLNRSSGVYIF